MSEGFNEGNSKNSRQLLSVNPVYEAVSGFRLPLFLPDEDSVRRREERSVRAPQSNQSFT